MPALRINMRKLKDALRLKFEGGQSHQQIATVLEISKGVVTKYVGLAVAAGLNWKAIEAIDEATLERRLLARLGFEALKTALPRMKRRLRPCPAVIPARVPAQLLVPTQIPTPARIILMQHLLRTPSSRAMRW